MCVDVAPGAGDKAAGQQALPRNATVDVSLPIQAYCMPSPAQYIPVGKPEIRMRHLRLKTSLVKRT